MGIESIGSNLLSPQALGSIASNLGSIGGKALFGVNDYIQKLSELDLQRVTKWEFTIARIPQFDLSKSGTDLLKSIGTGLLETGGSAIDALVTQLYVQTVSVPHLAIEYEQASGSKKYVKGTISPDQMDVTFIEDESGTVTRWLEEWHRNIVIKDPTVADDKKTLKSGMPNDGYALSSSINTGYVFKNNQEGAKRRGILQLKPSTNIPGIDDGSDLGGAIGSIGGSALQAFGIQSNVLEGLGSAAGRAIAGNKLLQFPTYIINGLRPLSRGNLEVNQDSPDPLRVQCTFSVESIEIMMLS